MIEAIAAPVLAAMSAVGAITVVARRSDKGMLAGLAVPSTRRRRPRARFVLIGRLGAPFSTRLPGRERLASLLLLAGSGLRVEEVTGIQVVLAAVAAVLAVLSPLPALAPLLAVAGFKAPELMIASRARRRSEQASRELPQLLDMLAAASQAGLSGQLALRRAVAATEGPLADELGAALSAADLGARWREELQAAADRLALPDLRRAVAALIRTGSLGTSLADSMTQLAAQVREERRVVLAERARKAPVKMLFPLVFLVLPAFLLLTVVPVLLTTLQSIR